MRAPVANIFDTIGAPVNWALVHLENGFAAFGPTKLIGAFGLAIITVTLIIRAALFPVFGWQLRAMARTQAEQRTVAPQLKQLRQRYRKEPQKLSQEMQKLYKEHGISPFSSCLGCLPALVQLPVLLALYQGIRLATGDLRSNLGFLWVPNLSKTLKDACCGSTGLVGLASHPLLLVIPVLAMLATYLQAKMMSPPLHEGMSDAERKQADLSKIFVYVGPAMVGLFSYSFFQGITLYWLTQSTFMIAQQYYVRGWGSVRMPDWVPGANRTTPLSFPRASLDSKRGAAVGSKTGGDRNEKTGGDRNGKTDGNRNGKTGGNRNGTSSDRAAPAGGPRATVPAKPGGAPRPKPPARSGPPPRPSNKRKRRR